MVTGGVQLDSAHSQHGPANGDHGLAALHSQGSSKIYYLFSFCFITYQRNLNDTVDYNGFMYPEGIKVSTMSL